MATGIYQDTLSNIWAAFKSNPALYAIALGSLKPQITPRRIKLNCPRCGDRNAWLLPGYATIQCNHENRCQQTSVLGYIIGQVDAPTGELFKQAVNELCKITNTAPPGNAPLSRPLQVNKVDAKPRAETANTNVIQTIWSVCHEAIQSANCPGRLYLYDRGFRDGFVSDNFGYIEHVDHLRGVVSEQNLRSLGLLAGGAAYAWNRRIIIPGYDKSGKLVGLSGRTLFDDKTQKDKYRNTTDYSLSETGGWNFHSAKQHETVILTEGQLDALACIQHGFVNVVAACTSSYSGEHFNALARAGVREIIYAGDNDNAGSKGLWSALDTCIGPDLPDVYVFDYAGRTAKDPCELLCGYGADEFRKLLDQSTYGLRFRARAWAKQFDFTRDGHIPRFIEKCIRYTSTVADSLVSLKHKTYFLPEVAELTGVDLREIQQIQDAAKDRKAKEDAAESLSRALEAATVNARAGRLDEAISTALAAVEGASAGFTSVGTSSIPMGESVIEEAESWLTRLSSREFIGLPVGSLPTLDVSLLGMRGLILVAGDTNVGKTILLGQLGMDGVQQNQDACAVFLTAEMSRRSLVSRMWSRLACYGFDELRSSFRQESAFRQRRTETKEQLQWFCERIKIIHPRKDKFVISERNILNEIAEIKHKTGRERCMLIVDYLDVLPAPPGYERADENEKMKAICEQLLNIKEAMGEEDPLVCVTEVRKRDTKNKAGWITMEDLMGTARKQYCSDTVLIWNRLPDSMLYGWFEIQDGLLLPLKEEFEFEEAVLKKPEVKKVIKEMRRLAKSKQIDFGHLSIPKVRDGGKKDEFFITVEYGRNNILEGRIT